MLRWSVRPAFFVLMLIVLASCSGAGGCSGCSGCGMTPLAAGFPNASVIPNSAIVRITRPGLDFISANLGTVAGDALGTGAVVTFNVPASSASFTVANADICKSPSPGQCVADINVAGSKLNLDAVPGVMGQMPPADEPSLQIAGTVPVKIDDIPVAIKDPIFNATLCTIDIRVGDDGSCAPTETYYDLPVSVTLPVVTETIDPRNGYSKIDADNAVITPNIDSSKVHICGGLCASIASLLQSTIVSQITGPLQSTLKKQLQTQLCTKASTTVTPPCPDGTVNDGGTCVFQSSTSTCVPTLLGVDGHMNLGSLVAKYSPGNGAAVDLVLAAAGAAEPSIAPPTTPGGLPVACAPNQKVMGGACVTDPSPPYAGHTPNGVTLGMLGGMLANPQSSCVPVVMNPIPQNIPTPDELLTDAITPWSETTGPDINLALAGRYISYALTSAYNSGVLCLGISTATFQALSTGYVSAVVPSLKDLTFEPSKRSQPASMAITTRPQKAPVVKIGNGTDVNKDPLLTITLPSFALDFYVWSLDRYVRAFTYTSDVTVPVNLQTGKDPKTNPNGGIIPVLGNLTTANGVVSNSDLVWEKPDELASALSALLSGIVGQFLGKGFSPINLNSSFAKYGIALDIPAGAFRKLVKKSAQSPNGEDDFIGLFANLTTATTGMARTGAALVGTEVHPEAMGLLSADRSKFPRLHVTLSSPDDDGSRAIEYATWIDEQPRSAWTTSRDVWVDDQYLFLQGKHTLYAAARFVGHPESEDDNPAAIPFIIDVLPPTVQLDTQTGAVTVHAYDYVSDDSALKVRWRPVDESGNGEWSEWAAYPSLGTLRAGAGAVSIEVQVQDEAGNVSDTNGLIRGRPDPTIPSSGSSCGCSTPGSPDHGRTSVLVAFGAIAALGVLARRRRSGALVIGSLGILAAASQGCSCGGGNSAQADAGGDAGECGPGCMTPCGTPNLLGLIGAYTSVAVAQDGTVWVAGYNDADVSNGLLYGDLVAGKYDSGKKKVAWVDVDGLPAAPGDGDCPPNAPNTWRNGLTDPGPDVGLWTSIQLDGSGNPMISYYDATNQALKFASSQDGGNTWASHTVLQAMNSDIGRYSKLLVVNGKPVITFLVIEPGMSGWAQSRVVMATGSKSLPAAAADWTTQNVLVDAQTPCKAQFCTGTDVCVQTTGQCQAPQKGCMPSDCGQSEAGIGATPQSCVTVPEAGTSCQAVVSSTYIDTYPNAEGDYIAVANGPQGIGVVLYDRTRGNLVGVANSGGTWTAQILDGQIGPNSSTTRSDTGDVGVGASLAIDSSGNWHVSYSNGWTEALQYLEVPSGNLMKPLAPEIVDDGLHLNGALYPDGQHIVGDDSSVTVDASGAVRIVYQDATAGTLHEATGAPSGNKHTWTVKALSQPMLFAGFFPHYVPQTQLIANWFRQTDHTQSPPVVMGDVAFVTP